MAALSKNWLTEKQIDFEYKQYILLAYLKEVSAHFEVHKLYPSLAELIEHYKQVISIKENKQNLMGAFPQRIHQLNLEKFRITYEKLIQDDALMNEIEQIIDFSIPKFEYYLSEGKKIYDFIEEQLHIYPIGVIPIRPEVGYLFLKDGKTADTNVYEYQITIFEQPDEKYRGIHTRFIKTYKQSFTHTFEFIKTDLIRENKHLPNPAAFAVEAGIRLPLEETFLPIAKRILVKQVA